MIIRKEFHLLDDHIDLNTLARLPLQKMIQAIPILVRPPHLQFCVMISNCLISNNNVIPGEIHQS